MTNLKIKLSKCSAFFFVFLYQLKIINMKKFCATIILLLTISNISFAGFPITLQKNISIESECDNIILKDGMEISAKIIEITPELIKYKKCGNLDGPLISIYKSDILMLRYADGTKDIMNVAKKIKNKDTYRKDNPSSSLAFLSMMLSFVSIFALPFLFAPAGIILGIISVVRDKNKAPGIIGLIIGSLSFIGSLFVLSLL